MPSKNMNDFKSPIPFDGTKPSILAIACLDGRFIPHFLNFLTQFTEIVDPFFIPGGVGNLNPERTGSPNDIDLKLTNVLTMIKLHPIKKVLMIGHQDCGFYKHSMPDSDNEQRYHAQCDDLSLFKARICTLRPELDVQSWYVFLENTQVIFRRIDMQKA